MSTPPGEFSDANGKLDTASGEDKMRNDEELGSALTVESASSEASDICAFSGMIPTTYELVSVLDVCSHGVSIIWKIKTK